MTLNNPGLKTTSVQLVSHIYTKTPDAFIKCLDTLLFQMFKYVTIHDGGIPNNKGHSTIKNVFQTMLSLFEPVFTMSDKMYKLENQTTMKITNELARGNYSVVYNGKYNNQDVIFKIPLIEEGYNVNIMDTYNFIRENLIHLLIQCFHDKFCKIAGRQLPAFVPQIELMCSITLNNKITPCVVMEKLEGHAFGFIFTNYSASQMIDMISQIAFALYYLQKYTSFNHRDMHIKNIMFTRRPLPINNNLDIATENLVLTIPQSTVHWYLIDFGLSCINFKCCDMQRAALALMEDPTGNSYYPINSTAVLGCKNVGYDMRLFLKNLVMSFPYNNPLTTYFNSKFSTIELSRQYSTFYEDYHKNHPAFSPLQILKDMASLLASTDTHPQHVTQPVNEYNTHRILHKCKHVDNVLHYSKSIPKISVQQQQQQRVRTRLQGLQSPPLLRRSKRILDMHRSRIQSTTQTQSKTQPKPRAQSKKRPKPRAQSKTRPKPRAQSKKRPTPRAQSKKRPKPRAQLRSSKRMQKK